MLSDNLLIQAQQIKTLEKLLSWAIKNDMTIHTMLQQDEFSSDIVLKKDNNWLVFDAT